MDTTMAVMRRELRDAFRGKWLPLYGGLFALLALGLSYLGQRNLGGMGFESYTRTTASLLNLCLLLAPLVALALGAGAVAGERDRGTLTYLLAQPVERWEVLVGKYAGLAVSIAIATTGGFAIAGLVIALYSASMDLGTYLLFLVLVLALVAVMTGIGVLASVVSATRVQALGLALMVWFVAVLFYDLVLVGLVSTAGLGGPALLGGLLLNPVEVVRVLAIINLEPDMETLGPFGSYLMETLGLAGTTALLTGTTLVWAAAPVVVAVRLFRRTDR